MTERRERHQEGVDDLDAILRGASEAIEEAASAGRAELARKAADKVADEEETALGYEQLIAWNESLDLDSSKTSDFAIFKWTADALEHTLDEAPPRAMQEAIDNFLKADGARKALLEQVRTTGVDVGVVQAHLDRITELRSKLFEAAKMATQESLVKLQKKHRGELDNVLAGFEQLKNSPLVRDIIYAPESPEFRERALKQEITEVFFGPAVEHFSVSTEKSIELDKEQIKKIKEALASDSEPWVRRAGYDISGLVIMQRLRALGVEASDEKYFLTYPGEAGKKLEAKQRSLETGVAFKEGCLKHLNLSLECNKIVVERCLADVHDEKQLHEALAELKPVLAHLRSIDNHTGGSNSGSYTKMQSLANPLARKLLTEIIDAGIGVSDSSANAYFDSNLRSFGSPISSTELLLGKNGSGLNAYGLNDSFTKFVVGERMKDIEFDLDASNPRNLETIKQNFVHYTGQIIGTSDTLVKFQAVLDGQFGLPLKADSQIEAMTAYAKSRVDLVNLRLAFKQVDRDLTKIPPRNSADDGTVGYDRLGWKKAKSGAIVAPGEKATDVEKEFSALLERLSDSELQTINLLDKPVGEKLPIYTLRQAHQALATARRDMADLIGEAGEESRADLEKVAGEKRGLLGQLEELRGELQNRASANERLQAQVVEKDGEIDRLKGESAKKDLRLTEVAEKNEKLFDALSAIAGELSGSLKSKAFGGVKVDLSVDDLNEILKQIGRVQERN